MDVAASFLVKDDLGFKECLWFLDRNYDDCLHAIQAGKIIKALSYGDDILLLQIAEAPEGLQVTLLSGPSAPGALLFAEAYIREWFDAGRDLRPFYRLLQREPKLAYMAKAFHGLRLIGIPDLFEALCWSIIGQQINLRFAYRFKRRLTEHFGKTVMYNGGQYFVFPDAAALADAPVDTLRAMQFSQRKAEYLISLAEAFRDGRISKCLLENLSGFPARQQVLTALRGIGIWTANYALMKSLRIAEAIPYGDAGLLQALVQHQLIRDRKDRTGMDHLFRRFAGWESYLVCYLWRSLSPEK